MEQEAFDWVEFFVGLAVLLVMVGLHGVVLILWGILLQSIRMIHHQLWGEGGLLRDWD